MLEQLPQTLGHLGLETRRQSEERYCLSRTYSRTGNTTVSHVTSELVALQRRLEDVGESVAGDADEARHLLFLGFHGGFVRAALGRDGGQIVGAHQGVY